MFELYPFTRSGRLAAYDPFRAMDDLEKAFFGSVPSLFNEREKNVFRTDIREADGNYILEADLPGFDKSDISVDVDGDRLTVKATRHSEYENKEGKDSYVRCERSYGSYARSFDVSGIDVDAIDAKYENGVLTLTLPKKEPEKPAKKQLEIQ